MRVAGQVRMMILPLLFFYFVFFLLFPFERILDGFIRGINNLFLSLSLLGDTLLWIFFFLKNVGEVKNLSCLFISIFSSGLFVKLEI